MRVEFRFCPGCGSRLVPRSVEGRTLAACPNCEFVAWPDPKVAVAVVARDDRGRVLLIRRGLDPARGQWSLPGGYLDATETPAAAARRECIEETHCDVEVGDLAVLHHELVEGGGLLVLVFAARLLSDDLRATAEAPVLQLFEPAELPELPFAAHRRALAACLADGGP